MRAILRRLAQLLERETFAADPSCPECYGNGFDGAAAVCRCVRPVHEVVGE